jgi:hypothetical protein
MFKMWDVARIKIVEGQPMTKDRNKLIHMFVNAHNYLSKKAKG